MRKVISVAVALAVLAVPSWAGLANHAWSGPSKTAAKGIYALVGEVDTGKGKLVLLPTEDTLGLATTDTGFTLTGSPFGSLSGGSATTGPNKQYAGSIVQADAVTWATNLLAASYADVTNVSATGIALFKTNADGSKAQVQVLIVYTANLSGNYLAVGTATVKAKLAPP